MNKSNRRRMMRRYTLPAIGPSANLNSSRVVPEGSDVFQKALEDLYLADDNEKPPKQINKPNRNILIRDDVIEEDEEENEVEEEEYIRNNFNETDYIKKDRRFSSPAFLGEPVGEKIDGKDTEKGKQNLNGVMKKHSQFRKEYFIKHGHWPNANGTPASTQSRYNSSTKHAQRGSFDIVFGSTYTKKGALIDKT